MASYIKLQLTFFLHLPTLQDCTNMTSFRFKMFLSDKRKLCSNNIRLKLLTRDC